MPKEGLIMENAMLWITVAGTIVIPFVVWLINTLITKKIDSLENMIEHNKKEYETNRNSDRDLFFRKLDEDRKNSQENYVQKNIYEQAMQFNNEKNDEKFRSMLAIMTTQFNNVEDKIDELKEIISDKFNGHNKNGG